MQACSGHGISRLQKQAPSSPGPSLTYRAHRWPVARSLGSDWPLNSPTKVKDTSHHSRHAYAPSTKANVSAAVAKQSLSGSLLKCRQLLDEDASSSDCHTPHSARNMVSHFPCRKMGAAGERPHRLAAAARRWPVARDRSPAWFGTCLEGFLCAPVAGGGTNAMDVS